LLSHTVKTVGVSDAITEHANTNGTQNFWSKIGHGAVTGLNWLGKPLQEVQKDYKFVHSVYTDHGLMPGFVATLGVVAGGALGALAGPEGAIVGADVGASITRQVMGKFYKDSYTKSEDANYKVSAGRDFSNALSLAVDGLGGPQFVVKALKDTNAGIGKVISGATDLAVDVRADPVMLIGRFGQLMRGGKYLKLGQEATLELRYPIMNAIPGVKDFLAARTGVALTSEQMDAVYKGTGIFNATARNYRRALEDIANSNAGEIAVKYPTLGVEAAGRLGRIDSAEGVHQFLKEVLFFSEKEGNIAGQAMLPTRTLLKATLNDKTVADKIAEITENKLSSIPGISPDAAKALANGVGNVVGLPPKALQYLRNAENGWGDLYKTFSSYMPYSIDAKTLELSTTKFRWNAPDSALTVYRIARFGMGDSMAKKWAAKYAEAVAAGDIGLARNLKNESLFETLKAVGLPNDPRFVEKSWEAIHSIGEDLVSTQSYGVKTSGEQLGEYVANGERKIAGIWSHQMDEMFSIPDFLEIQQAMRDAGRFSKIGKIDDWVAKHYTNKWFKPLALATGGFGLRVAAAELIPAFARYGIINTMHSKIAATVAKTGYNLVQGEDEHIMSAALMSLGAGKGIPADALENGFSTFKEAKRLGLNLAAQLAPKEQIDLATRIIMANEGHFLSDAVKTGHGSDASTAYQMGQAAHYYFQLQKDAPLFREKAEWRTYSANDNHYVPRLSLDLAKASKNVAQKNIATDALQASKMMSRAIGKSGEVVSPRVLGEEFYNTPEYQQFRDALINREYARMIDGANGTYKPYTDEIRTSTRWQDSINSGDLHTFAADRVDAMLGMLMGRDGTFHSEWADSIAKGKSVDIEKLSKTVNASQKSMPRSVSGPILEPYMGGDTRMQKVINIGFKKFIDPIVNGLAREPLYMMHVSEAYARLAPRIGRGLTEDQALRIAQQQGSLSMIPQIHNTALRSQFSQVARNFLPFYFAQEQSLKRAFNTLKDTSIVSPAFSRGFRFYQLAEHALSDPGFVETDDQGNKYLYLPGVGAFGEGLQTMFSYFGANLQAGLPITAKGSLVSLKSVLPEFQMPGVSPFVAVGGNIISHFFPSAKPIIDKGIGSISVDRGIWDTLIPAPWAKTLASATTSYLPGGGIDLNNQMGNAIASALASAYYHGKVPGPDSNAMERQAYVDRIKNNARSILMMKFFLNLTSPLAPTVSQEDAGFRDEFWKLVKQKGNYADALQTFLGEHGNTAISYTVAKTYSNVPGAKVPYIQSTIDFIKQNNHLFTSDGTSSGAFFLVPQDNVQSSSERTVYNELMSMHFRSQRTPEELLKQFYIAQGDQAMSAQIQEHRQIMKDAISPFQRETERARWSGVTSQMQNFFPIWYDDYTKGGSATNAKTAYNQIVNILNSPNRPQGKQIDLVEGLVKQYQQHQLQASQYKALNIQGFLAQQNQDSWNDYLTNLAVEEPRLATVINSVFMKLG
jgi:hypothetical protein